MSKALHAHKFYGVWKRETSSSRVQIALICRTCKMRVDEPRYSRDRKTGKDVCYTLGQFPSSCEEYVVQFVHNS